MNKYQEQYMRTSRLIQRVRHAEYQPSISETGNWIKGMSKAEYDWYLIARGWKKTLENK